VDREHREARTFCRQQPVPSSGCYTKIVRAARSGEQDVRDPDLKKLIDEFALVFYYHLNTGKEVIDNI